MIKKALLILFFLAAILLIAVFILLFINNFYPDFLVSKKPINNGKLAKENTLVNWKVFPYFGKNFNFIVSFQENWKIDYYEFTPDMLHDNQPVIIFKENNNIDLGVNSLGIYYFNDTGDDLITWANKRKNDLKKMKGYEPSVKEFEKGGNKIIQYCFLGRENFSPMPDCFAYVRQEPYILEFNAASGERTFPAQVYIEKFTESFYFFNIPQAGWKQYFNSNLSLEIQYPQEKYPPKDENFEREKEGYPVVFTKDYIGQFMSIRMLSDWNAGAVQFWYNEIKNNLNTEYNLPREIIIDDNTCLMADFDNYSYEGLINPLQILCPKNDKLYIIEINRNDEEVDNDIFNMLFSLKFYN